MDLEEIKNKLSCKEEKPYNKKFLKKMLLSNCTINFQDEYPIKILFKNIISDDLLSDEKKEELLSVMKTEIKNGISKQRDFLNELFNNTTKETKENDNSTDNE